MDGEDTGSGDGRVVMVDYARLPICAAALLVVEAAMPRQIGSGARRCSRRERPAISTRTLLRGHRAQNVPQTAHRCA
jgi:hypothetical protein